MADGSMAGCQCIAFSVTSLPQAAPQKDAVPVAVMGKESHHSIRNVIFCDRL